MSTNPYNQKKQNIVGNYRIEKTIGEGTFGKVKLAIHIPTGEQVAIKILEKSKINDQDELERVEKEIKYLKILNHPNIIQIYEIIENSKNFYLVMEYAPGGELFNYIVKNEKIGENESSYFFSQIIHGIEEIHRKKICHRDIKPENLLLTTNKIIKIIDFGLSNEYDKFLSTPCGSPCYASPEMIRGVKYNGLSVDLWASGIILYAMVCGYLPFDDKNNEKLFEKILQCKVEFPSEEETKISPECKDLILKILTPNPAKRIKLDEIKLHPFMAFGNVKYINTIKEDNFAQEDLIISYMVNQMNFDNRNSNIKNALLTNRHNNITTTFKLLKKKYIEGRFNGEILITNPNTPSSSLLTHSKILSFRKNVPIKKNANQRKRNFNITGSLSSNHSMISELNNVIKENKMEQGNIIIINNTNMISSPPKMNGIYEKLINANNRNNNGVHHMNNQLIRKIDTSVSVDKTTKKHFTRDNSKSKPSTDKEMNTKIKTPELSRSNIKNQKISGIANIKKTRNNKITIPINYVTNTNANSVAVSPFSKRAISDPSKRKTSTVSKTKPTSVYNHISNINTNSNYNTNTNTINQNILNTRNHCKDILSSERIQNTEISPQKIAGYGTQYNAPVYKKTHKMNTLTLKIPSQYTKKELSPHTKYTKNTYQAIATNTNNKSKNKDLSSIYEPLSTRIKQCSNLTPATTISGIGSVRRKSNIISDVQLGRFNTNVVTKKPKDNYNEKQILILKKPKATKHFVVCSSQLPVKELENKIIDICNKKKLIVNKEGNNNFVVKVGDNKFMIEMAVENISSTMMKFYHLEGDEEITKKHMKDIFTNVGFL